jgi:hypothetical protein
MSRNANCLVLAQKWFFYLSELALVMTIKSTYVDQELIALKICFKHGLKAINNG